MCRPDATEKQNSASTTGHGARSAAKELHNWNVFLVGRSGTCFRAQAVKQDRPVPLSPLGREALARWECTPGLSPEPATPARQLTTIKKRIQKRTSRLEEGTGATNTLHYSSQRSPGGSVSLFTAAANLSDEYRRDAARLACLFPAIAAAADTPFASPARRLGEVFLCRSRCCRGKWSR